MKKLQLLFNAFLLTSAVFAQSPGMINYKGVALNASGTAIANQTIAIGASVHQATTNGTIVYSEERSVATDAGGLFNFAISSPGTSATTGSWAAAGKITCYTKLNTATGKRITGWYLFCKTCQR
jgi:hypothetical protein